jgi:hypothetical protein
MGIEGYREFGNREEFERFILETFGLKLGGSNAPASNDPADYDRSVQIDDLNILTQIWAFEKALGEYKRLSQRVDVLNAKLVAARKQIFLDCHEAYPDIERDDEEGGVGWRGDSDSGYYYVAWKGKQKKEDAS